MQPPQPEVVRRMSELAAMHREWTLRHADAEPKSSDAPDYSVHHVDVDPPAGAEDEFVRRARQIEGCDPETGAYPGWPGRHAGKS